MSADVAVGTWRSLDLNTDWNAEPYEEVEERVSFAHLRASWHEFAVCSSMGPDPFFGAPDEKRSMSPREIKAAAEICKTCPVFADCLTYALEHNEQYGVWAGTSGRVRVRIQRMITIGMVDVAGVVDDYVNGRTEAYEGRRQEGAGKASAPKASSGQDHRPDGRGPEGRRVA